MKTLAPAIFAVFLPLAQRTIWRDVNVVPASDADHQAKTDPGERSQHIVGHRCSGIGAIHARWQACHHHVMFVNSPQHITVVVLCHATLKFFMFFIQHRSRCG